jgi:FkbM family methyltransferase
MREFDPQSTHQDDQTLLPFLRRPYARTFPTTNQLRRWRHDGRSRLSRARTFWGDQMQIRLPDDASIALRRFGYLDYELSAFLLRQLHPGDTFVDVGAHVGYFSRLAAHCVGPDGHIYSFEPTPSTFALLAGNLRSVGGATAVQAAVWDSAGRLPFADHGFGYSVYNSAAESCPPPSLGDGVATTTREVEAVTLDGFLARRGARPQVVKVDVGSAEKNVIAGMSGLLGTTRPIVILEVGSRGPELVGLMRAHDYQVYELHDGVARPHQPQPAYRYDNLLFVASEKRHLLDV